MDVGIRELKDNLSRYVARVRDGGEEFSITDHGRAVALIVPVGAPRVLDRLVSEGLVTSAESRASRKVPKRLKVKDTVSDLVSEQRG